MLKEKINYLAWLFYRLHGYQVELGHDFEKARHPQERLMFEMAKHSHEFWEVNMKLLNKKALESSDEKD